MINVLIVENHRLVAEGIARILDEEADFKVLKIVNTIGEAVAVAEKRRPKIILLGVDFSDGDGIEAVPRFRSVCPNSKIIILTMYAQAAVVYRAMRQEINGFLLKTASSKELIEAIRLVADNRQFICQESQALIDNEAEEISSLTNRERDILKFIVEGLSQKQIADKLCLGFETVHGYTKMLRKKLNCGNTASVVRKAIRQHLV